MNTRIAEAANRGGRSQRCAAKADGQDGGGHDGKTPKCPAMRYQCLYQDINAESVPQIVYPRQSRLRAQTKAIEINVTAGLVMSLDQIVRATLCVSA